MNCVASHPYIARPRITQPRTALVQSVVRVRAFDAFRPWSRSHGSGFLWDHNGHIVSCQLYSGLVFRKHISKTGSSRNNLWSFGPRSPTFTLSSMPHLSPCTSPMACSAEPRWRQACSSDSATSSYIREQPWATGENPGCLMTEQQDSCVSSARSRRRATELFCKEPQVSNEPLHLSEGEMWTLRLGCAPGPARQRLRMICFDELLFSQSFSMNENLTEAVPARICNFHRREGLWRTTWSTFAIRCLLWLLGRLRLARHGPDLGAKVAAVGHPEHWAWLLGSLWFFVDGLCCLSGHNSNPQASGRGPCHWNRSSQLPCCAALPGLLAYLGLNPSPNACLARMCESKPLTKKVTTGSPKSGLGSWAFRRQGKHGELCN